MQHFLKIGGKRYGEVRNFKKVRKFASSNLKFRSSKFKFTEILICNPGKQRGYALSVLVAFLSVSASVFTGQASASPVPHYTGNLVIAKE